jgi:hypothetical protein
MKVSAVNGRADFGAGLIKTGEMFGKGSLLLGIVGVVHDTYGAVTDPSVQAATPLVSASVLGAGILAASAGPVWAGFALIGGAAYGYANLTGSVNLVLFSLEDNVSRCMGYCE